MTHRLFTVLSVIFFLVMMTLLARDHVIPMLQGINSVPISRNQLAETWPGKDEWMTVYLNDSPVGVMRNTVQRSDDGYHAFFQAFIEAPLVRGRIAAGATMDSELSLEQVRLTLQRDGTEEPLLQLAGRIVEDTLFLRLSSQSGVRYREMKLRDPLTLNLASDPFMSRDNMTVGETYSLPVYDPIWGMQAGNLRFTLTGTEEILVDEEIYETAVIEADMDNIQSTIWLDGSDQPVRREITISLSNDSESEAEGIGGITIRLDRIPSPTEHPMFEKLRDHPPVPDLRISDLKGDDQGQPLNAAGLLPMMMQQQIGQ